MTATVYPFGYGSSSHTLAEMSARYERFFHPEFWRRWVAYVVHKDGLFGVGGGHRFTQPIAAGFAPPGKSFHELQRYASGLERAAAIDLVVPTGGRHRAPTWAESDDAHLFGLHTFIRGEPWHLQCIEMRGHTSWVNAGRPDPQPFTLPTPEAPPAPPPAEDPFMFKLTAHMWKHRLHDAVFYISETGEVLHVDGDDVEQLLAAGVKLRTSTNEDVYQSYAARYGGARPNWAQ